MPKIRPLSEYEYRQEVSHVFNSIFQSDDPFDEPMRPTIHPRAILYPVAYELEPVKLQAVVAAAQVVGDIGFYLSVTERPPVSDQNRPYHWFIPLEDPGLYYSLNGYQFVLENAIYSPKGRWGMIISHEQHAIVGGCDPFLNTLFAHLSVSEAEQVNAFLSNWRDNYNRFGSKIDWLPRLMTHAYGVEEAQRLLMEAGLA